MFDGHSYNKGGRILHMLRTYLGDDLFFQGLNKYLTTNAYQSAEIHNLRLAMEEVSGEDLNWFFNQWFLGKGHPVIFTEQEINNENKTVTISVQQAQSFDVFRLPIKYAVWDSEGKHSYEVVLDSVNQKFTFPFKGKLENVLLDDDQHLLAKVYEEKPDAHFIHQYYNASAYRAKATALKRLSKSGTKEANAVLMDALNAPFWGIRTQALSYIKNIDGIDFSQLTASLKSILANEKKSQVRKAAVELLSNLDKTEGISIIRKIINQDSSLLVLGSALNELKDIDTVAALTIARELSQSSEIELRVGAAEIMGEYGSTQDKYFVESLIEDNKVKDYNSLRTLLAYAYYVIRNGSSAMDNAPKILAYSKEHNNKYVDWYYGLIVDRFLEIIGEESGQIDAELESLNIDKDARAIQLLKDKKSKLDDLYNRISPFAETENTEEK
jgi:aminopeptidase N